MPRVVIASASEHKGARFSAARRLHVPREFAAVLDGRKLLRGECFDLHYGHGPIMGSARLGLIVPKRLARTASLRNVVKRQGREAFRLAATHLQGDMVLRLKKTLIKDVSDPGEQKRKLRREIEALLQRLLAVRG